MLYYLCQNLQKRHLLSFAKVGQIKFLVIKTLCHINIYCSECGQIDANGGKYLCSSHIDDARFPACQWCKILVFISEANVEKSNVWLNMQLKKLILLLPVKFMLRTFGPCLGRNTR